MMNKYKKSKCIYCNKEVFISKMCSHVDTKCKSCRRVWQKLRNKYGDYGENINVHDLVRWYINQPQKCAECGSTKKLTIDRKISGHNGGKYELNNIQILCYKCNCCLKTSCNSVAESQIPLTEKTCNNCGKTFPLTSEYWHKLKPSKYRKLSLCHFHPECKKCRNARESKRWSITHPIPQRPSMIKYWENYK